MKSGVASLLFERLLERARNLVFSPLSMGTCLAMAVIGLRGNSKTELLTFMSVPHEVFLHRTLAERLAHKGAPTKIANRILVDRDCVVRQTAEFLIKVR